MKTNDFGIVRVMRDHEDAGYGPSYVADRGKGWLFWVANQFDPSIWFINCESIEEAFEHAEICICPNLMDDEQFVRELAQLATDHGREELLRSWGGTMAADGSLRYTEILQCMPINRK